MLQVGSRRVLQLAAIFLLFFGMLGKFGALFVTIPDPVMGGVFLIMFGKSVVYTLCPEKKSLQYCICNFKKFKDIFIIYFWQKSS